MAFILKSTKLIPGLVGFTRQRCLIGKIRNCIFLQDCRNSRLDEFLVRSTTSLAIDLGVREHFEKSFFQLSKDVKRRNILIENIEEVFRGIKEKGVMTDQELLLLLKSCSETAFICSNTERVQLAEDIWKTAEDLGLKFTINHYNALLDVFLENNHQFSQSNFLNVLKENGLEPDAMTYRKLLRAEAQSGNIEGVNSILNQIKELKYPLNKDDFNSLILGYCEVGDLEKAADIINIMQEKDIDPGQDSYLYLLCGYAKHGEYEELNKLLDILPEKDIPVTDSLLLEVIYALADSQNEESEKLIDMLLGRLKNNNDSRKFANRVIQRLLHKRLDGVALKVFENLVKGQTLDFMLFNSKFIIIHCVMYRSPDEIFDMCKLLTEKGWCKAGESYALRQAFLKKDEIFCMKLLQSLKAHNMEIRQHYFWPPIIKAAKKGNEQMFNILRQVPRNVLNESYITVSRVILPNYRFGANPVKDFDILHRQGVRASFLSSYFIGQFIKRFRYDMAETFASMYPVERPVSLVRLMVKNLRFNPHAEKHFVNALYYLAHDKLMNDEEKKRLSSEELPEKGSNNGGGIFDAAIKCVEHMSDEKVVLAILQGMLEKKMHITTPVGSNTKNQEILDALAKLASPELQFEYDKSILEKKSSFTEEKGSPESESQKVRNRTYENRSPERESQKVRNKIYENRPPSKEIRQVSLTFEELWKSVLQKHTPGQVVALLERSTKTLKDTVWDGHKRQMYFELMKKYIYKEKLEFAKRMLHLGLKTGALTEDNKMHFVRILIGRGFYAEAVEMYCYHFGGDKAYNENPFEILSAVAEGNDAAALKKLTTALMAILPKHAILTRLSQVFAGKGELEKAKRILDGNRLFLDESRFYAECKVFYKTSPVEKFENYLKFVEGMKGFDRVPLYKILIRKYAQLNDVEKAEALWKQIMEDDISDYDFLEKMREFVNQPNVINLKSLAYEVEKADRPLLHGELIPENMLEDAFNEAMKEYMNPATVGRLASSLAHAGKTEKLIALYSRYRTTKKGQPAKFFSKGKKYDEFFAFIEHYAKEGKFHEVSAHLSAFWNMTNLRELSNDFVQRMKDLSYVFYNTGKIDTPLNHCFGTLIGYPERVGEAEDLLLRHLSHFRGIDFHRMAPWKGKLQFYHGLLSSAVFKKEFSHLVPKVYSSLIYLHYSQSQLDSAVKILNEAVKNGLGMFIEKSTLEYLNRGLTEKGKEFPYPELLPSQPETLKS